MSMNSVESRALELLGAGVQQESVAAALGVTPARISQLLSQDDFARKVSEARYDTLQKHNARDAKYDSIEDTLLDKLSRSIPLLVRPESILGAIRVVNSAARRGSSTPQAITAQQTVVSISLPSAITQRFAVNVNNQVIRAGEQDLITMKPNVLAQQIEDTEYELITYNGQAL